MVDVDTRIDGEDEDIFNFSERRANLFSRMWNKTKIAIMGTLFVMGEDISMGHLMFMLGMAIDFFQTLQFPFNSGSEFPWNEYYSAYFAEAANVQEMTVYMSQTNTLQNFIVCCVSLSLVMLNLVIAAIVGYKFSKNQVQNVVLLTFVRWICNLFTTILYLPLLDQFALISSCEFGYQTFDGCPTQLPAMLLGTTSLSAGVIFGLLAFVVIVSFYEQDPSSEELSAKPHARLELMYLMIKAIYTMVFSYFGDPNYTYQCLAVLLVCSTFSCSCFILYMPVYTVKIAIKQAQYQCLFLWAALSLAFCIIENNPEDGAPIILYYIGNISMWILTKYACEWRMEMLEKKTLATVSNPLEVELVTRFMLLKRFHTLNPEHMKDSPELRSAFDEIEEFYFQAERKFPKSCLLQLFAAQFYLTYRESVPDSIVKMEKASKLSPFIDEQFVIYKSKQNAKKHAGSDVVTFVTFNTYLQAAHKEEISAMRGQVQFWSELISNEEPSIDRMVNLSKFITHHVGEANQFYTILMRMNPNHSKLLHMYGFFLADVINEEDQSFNLHNRAQGLTSVKDKSRSRGAGLALDQRRMKLLLSADKGSFGRIEYASKFALELLQVPKTYIVNELIANFIPKLIATEFLSFLKRCTEQIQVITDEFRISTVFLDGAGFMIYCLCVVSPIPDSVRHTFIDNAMRQETQDSARAAVPKKLIESVWSSHIVSERDPRLSVDHLHMECVVSPIPEADCALLVNIDGLIIHISQSASVLTGITPDVTALKNINEVVFMYNRYFEEAMMKATVDYYGNYIPYPINTFIVSNEGKFSRVSMTFTELKLQRNSLTLINISALGNFDKKTQRFFDLFTKCIKGCFGNALQANFDMSNMAVGQLFNSHRTEGATEKVREKESESQRLFMKMRKRVADSNNVFSSELRRVSQILLWTLLVLVSLEIASFVLVEMLYNSIMDDMNVIAIATDIQLYSLSLSQITLLLDFSRRGIDIKQTNEYYISLMNTTLSLLSQNLDQIKGVSHIASLKDEDVVLLTKNVDWSLDYAVTNPVDACIKQLAHARVLVEGSIDQFDVFADPNAFFVYENGRRAIAQALDQVSKEAESDTDDWKTYQEVCVVVFAVTQCVVVLLGFAFQSPFSLKAERVYLDVIRVFFAIPKTVVNFLLESSKTNFTLMQNDAYPDNKVKIMNEEGLDFGMFLLRTVRMKKTSGTDDLRRNLTDHYNHWSRKIVLLLRNTVARRVLICFLFLLAYILILEMYVGQMLAYTSVQLGPSLLRDIGELKVVIARSSLAALDIIYCRPMDELYLLRNQTFSMINDTSIYTIESMEDAESNFFSQTTNIGMYLNLFRVGNDSLHISYQSIYPIQISDFFPNFFQDGCLDINVTDCESFYGGILSDGLYASTQMYRSDIEAVAMT